MPDSATQLVRAYLHVNGYFTATEYPLVEKSGDKVPRRVTDIDLLAIRSGHRVADTAALTESESTIFGPVVESVDPALGWLALLKKCDLKLAPIAAQEN